MGDESSLLYQDQWSGSNPIPEIIESLADLEDTPPSELDSALGGPLYEYIDPETLEKIITQSEDVTVSFAVEWYQIEIDDSQLSIYEEP